MRKRVFAAIAAAGLIAGFTAAARADNADTLWQDMGGVDNITKIANDTADNFLADPRIKATFDNTNIDRFKKLLAEQFCAVAGGPCTYSGRTRYETHQG